MKLANSDSIGHVQDLSKNPFVQLLNRGSRNSEFGSMVFPASRLLKAVENDRKLKEKGQKTSFKTFKKSIGGKSQLIQKVKQLQRDCEILKEDWREAFPIERESLKKQIDELEAKLAVTEKSLITLQKKEQQLKEVKRPSSSLRLKKQIDKILEKFPGSQLLDLSVLTTFKNKDGLPAVTIFSLNDSTMRIRLEDHRESRFLASDSSIIRESQHSILFRNLASQIAAATGVICGCKSEALKKYVSKAKAEKWYKGGKELPEIIADSIELATSFKPGARIPPEIRALIRSARQSGVFKNIYLLTEVEQWDITYYDISRGKSPFLHGKVVNTPKSKDPLIVAPAMIGKKELWFVIGAFDVTSVEKLIHDEFTTNPAAR